MRLVSLLIIFCFFTLFASAQSWRPTKNEILPDKSVYKFWEDKTIYTTVYHVNPSDSNSNDGNSGTEQAPFKTIEAALNKVQAGEKILVYPGIYREKLVPKNQGTGPDKMIAIEAKEFGKTIITGNEVLIPENWAEEKEYNLKPLKDENGEPISKYITYDLREYDFKGYNPFGMMNILHDREWLQHREKIDMGPFFKKRGQVFLEDTLLKQTENLKELQSQLYSWWVEHDGLRIIFHVPYSFQPVEHKMELTIREQVISPEKPGLGYIKLKGLVLRGAANGYPVPQRGLVSAKKGHHWLIEDCTIEDANSLGFDLGYQIWGVKKEKNEQSGGHIIRNCMIRNCGVGGIAGMWADDFLIEKNQFENIGFSKAEPAFESGAIKLHNANSCLIRNNLFREVRSAPGIWLDYECKNNRISQNIFTAMTTSRGGVYIEVSRFPNEVDHNIFHDIHSGYWLSGTYGAGGSALYSDGSDFIHFHNNLCMEIENTGFGAYLNATRMVSGRGGTMRKCTVSNNLFYKCQTYALDIPNLDHTLFSNKYIKAKQGYFRIRTPEDLYLNTEAVQSHFSLDKNSSEENFEIVFNSKTLEISFKNAVKFKTEGPFILDYPNASFKVDLLK